MPHTNLALGCPLVDEDIIHQQVRWALEEDVGGGDVTAGLIDPQRQVKATVISREVAVLCGLAWFNEVFRQLDPTIHIQWHFQDGEQLSPDTVICELQGNARSLLSGERSALNFLQTLSGTATLTQRYVTAVEGTPARVLDTRKTLPGLRMAQKYAVCCGGGVNHRKGLYDMVLIKENHIASAGSIESAVARARQQQPQLAVEVEVENLDQLREAIDSGVDRVLLDNMALQEMREAVTMARGIVELEASGGVNLDSIAAIAATGVDYISVGSITKDVTAVDFSMRFI